MPNYDYECKTCGHSFEAFQNMSDPPLSTCPKCGNGVRRLIGGGLGIIFKGSGFYVTDSKKSSSALAGTGKSSEGKAAESSKEPAAKESKSSDAPASKEPKAAASKATA